ncbi:ATP-binding protein [Sphingomonas sp. 22R3R2A-7]|uniref:ATP-binding protein n=1 Tax=Sphingomonas sp. 22R3R2A-7 TaxID=3050230 RepID=UPI002FE09CA8
MIGNPVGPPSATLLPSSSPRTHVRVPAARLLVLLGTLFVASLAAAALALVVARHAGRLDDAERELRTLDLLLAGETERSFQSVRLVLDGVAARLAASGEMTSGTVARRASTKAMHQELRARLSGLPQLEAVTIVAADGRIANYSREWPVRYWNLSDRSYFRAMIERTPDAPYISEPLVDRFTKQPTVYLVRRLSGPDGSFAGIVIGAIRLNYFNRFYETLRLLPGEFIALRRPGGDLITAFPNEGSSDPHVASSGPAGAASGNVPGVRREEPTAADGSSRPRLVATTITHDFSIHVAVGRDEKTLLAGWRSEAWAIGVAVALVGLLTASLLWAVLRRWHALELVAIASTERAEAVLARRDVEGALLQAQKMDALGQLAGGIAHDFNNMLAVVSGCLEMLRHRLGSSEDGIGRCLDRSDEAVRRATSLTTRLLSFARKEPVRHVAIEVNPVISGIVDLLTRTLGGGVTVDVFLGGDLLDTRGDVSQLENAILNLSVNARDAMLDGGAISITTANVDLEREDPRAPDLDAGRFVQISVSDSGTGMSPETAARIFEPFFTTKGAGKGTGLGLSQVFAFARDAGGTVRVETAVGRGTTFHLYLPTCSQHSVRSAAGA